MILHGQNVLAADILGMDLPSYTVPVPDNENSPVLSPSISGSRLTGFQQS